MKKQIIIFNGVNGAGKSTLAEDLAHQDSRFVFYPEIGRQVREEVPYSALESGEPFDRVVMKRECDRDEILLNENRIPLVETWHIGNIAYLHARTPALINEYRAALIRELNLFAPFCFFVDIDWKVFRLRATERIRSEEMDLLIAFYKVIKDSIFSLYKEFDIPYKVIVNQGRFSEGLLILRNMIDDVIKGGV